MAGVESRYFLRINGHPRRFYRPRYRQPARTPSHQRENYDPKKTVALPKKGGLTSARRSQNTTFVPYALCPQLSDDVQAGRLPAPAFRLLPRAGRAHGKVPVSKPAVSKRRKKSDQKTTTLANQLGQQQVESATCADVLTSEHHFQAGQPAAQFIDKKYYVAGTSVVDFLGVVNRNLPSLCPSWDGFAKELFLSKLDLIEGEIKERLGVDTRESLEVIAAWALELGEVLDYLTGPSPQAWVNVRITYLEQLSNWVYKLAHQVWEQDQSKEKTEGFCRGVWDYLIGPILTERRVRFQEDMETIRKVVPSWRDGSDFDLAADTLREESDLVLNEFRLKADVDARLSEVRENAPAVDETAVSPTPGRKGYRKEVRAWMRRKRISTIERASIKLGVSTSTLKSIMSDKGKPRYGNDTLESVLEKIGCQRG